MKPSEVGIMIAIVSNQIKRQVDQSVTHQKLTGVQGRILHYILANVEDHLVFQRDIEEEFNLRRSTATGILQLMEKNGIIRRESVDYDARLKSIIPTDEGRTLQAKVEEDLLKLDTRMLHGFTKTDEKTLIELLRRISQNLQ